MVRVIKAELRKRDELSPQERAWFVALEFKNGTRTVLDMVCPVKEGFPDIDDVVRFLVKEHQTVKGSIGYD